MSTRLISSWCFYYTSLTKRMGSFPNQTAFMELASYPNLRNIYSVPERLHYMVSTSRKLHYLQMVQVRLSLLEHLPSEIVEKIVRHTQSSDNLLWVRTLYEM